MQLYLYINCALYALFAAWCTMAPASTSTNLGYLSLSAGGRSEYLVIYGGIQVGLAILFGLLARQPDYWRLGMQISLALYAPIVCYRVVTVARNWPVGGLTAGTAVLEILLLAAALVIYWRTAR
jgi:hypothetical protein